MNHRFTRASLHVLLASAVVLLTATFGPPGLASAASVRPTDGTAPLEKYRWVAPPPFFAADNQTPSGVRATVPLRASGSEPTGVVTPDGQVVLTLGTDAIAPRGADRRVRILIEPQADGAALPDGLRANGNEYRISMTYQPSGAPVRELAHPGTMVLAVPELNTQLFRTVGTDGWCPIDARSLPPRNLALSAVFDRPGTYLSATNLPELAGPRESDDHSTAWLIVGAAVIVVAVGASIAIHRRQRAAPT